MAPLLFYWLHCFCCTRFLLHPFCRAFRRITAAYVPATMSTTLPTGNLPETPPAETPKDGRPLLVILIALCAIFIFTYALRLDTRDQREAEIALQQQLNEQAIARTAELERERQNVGRTGFADTMIRTLLQMGKPGEQVLVGVNAPVVSSIAPQSAAPVLPQYTQPIWQQWIELLAPVD